MDVRLPDGTVISNVPDGITKAELDAKLQANGYDMSKLAAPELPAQPQAQENDLQRRVNALPSFSRALVGAGETGLQALSGMASSVVGGMAGLGDLGLSLAGSGSGLPGSTVRKVQEFGTYQPRTEQGKLASKTLGLPMEFYTKGVHKLGDMVRGPDSGGTRDFLGTTVDVAGESLPAVVGGVAALRGAARATPAPLSPQQRVLAEAQKEGYTVPPSLIGKPSVLEATGGKARTGQIHSANNAEITTKIAARELGLPEGTTLTPEVLSKYRSALYDKGYLPLKQRQAPLVADEAYINEIVSLPSRANEIRASFPDAPIAGLEAVEKLANGQLQQRMTYSAAVERIRQLRSESKTNFKAFDKPDQMALAHAQRAAADSLEALMERSLAATGDTAAVTRFRMAREHIAKSHTIEDAMNPATGDVSLRSLANSKAPMTGGLATAQRFGQAFPKAAQRPESFGGTPPFSPLDVSMGSVMGVAGAAASGPTGLLAGGLPLLRPLAAPITQSPFVQNSLVRNPRPLPPELGLLPLLDPTTERLR